MRNDFEYDRMLGEESRCSGPLYDTDGDERIAQFSAIEIY